MTKKIIKFSLFVLTVLLLAVSCGGNPGIQPPPPDPAQPQTPPPAATTDTNRHQSGIILTGAATHTVRQNDTLSEIAVARYGDYAYYPLIMMVSGSVTDPDLLEPGWNLTVPVLNTNLNDARAKESMTRYFSNAARIEEQRGRATAAATIRNRIR